MDFYTLDRSQVAERLQVSTRTVDRYVAKNIFSTVRRNGKILFDSREIQKFFEQKNTESIDIQKDTTSTRLRHIQDSFDTHVSTQSRHVDMSKQSGESMSERVEKSFSHTSTLSTLTPPPDHLNLIEWNRLKNEGEIYKKLYAQAVSVGKDQRTKLDEAYYRIGALEQQLKQSVPLLEAQNSQKDMKKQVQEVEQKYYALQNQQAGLEQAIIKEKMVKKLYFAMAMGIVVAFSVFFALM